MLRKLIHLHLRVPVHRRGRRRSRQITGRFLHVITGTRHKTWMKIKDTLSRDNFSLNTLANEINRCIGPMVNKLEDLGTRLKHIEAELNKYAPTQDNVVEIPAEDKPSPYDPNICLPTFPDKFNLDVFCNWVKEIEFYLEYYCVARPVQVELVVSTLPQEGEAFKWWQDIQKLNEKVYKNDPITWPEMKMLFMDKFISP
ncbi:unnamed protein product [Lactuca saligna]|uniref:Retrotransposon gag domain-containing protein n=1 Tax=Lactuca saligna TaxID=75948 RepID=A0AA35ZZQ1_LACSI|nr:unnamed protein product [Lactuca saligna]